MAGMTTGKPRTVQQTELTPGTFVVVRGRTEYSRLLTPIDGDELEKDKIRKSQAGIQPITKPYTTVQITDARVLPRDPSGIMNKEEQFVDQRLYRRNAEGPNAPWHFTCTNKNTSQPNQFYQARPNSPTEADRIIPERELANGLDVVLVLRIFESQTFQRKGIALYSIILQEPIRYYAGNNDKALAAAGIVLHGDAPVAPAPAAGAPANPAPVGSPAPGAGLSSDTAQQPPVQQGYQAPPAQVGYQAPPQPQQPPVQQGYQAPAPQAGYQAPPQSQQPPVQQGYQAPPQQPSVQQGYQAPAPAQPQGDTWLCPNCQNRVPVSMPFCGTCGTHRPDNAVTPGINYDANARDY